MEPYHGKSLIISFIAILLALNGYCVDVLCFQGQKRKFYFDLADLLGIQALTLRVKQDNLIEICIERSASNPPSGSPEVQQRSAAGGP